MLAHASSIVSNRQDFIEVIVITKPRTPSKVWNRVDITQGILFRKIGPVGWHVMEPSVAYLYAIPIVQIVLSHIA